MAETIVLDQAGRLPIPQSIRDQMDLKPGARLRVEVIGNRLEISEDAPGIDSMPEARIEWRGNHRVIVGVEGFDAAAAVKQAREEQIQRLIRGHESGD